MRQVKLDELAGNIGWKDSQLRHLGCNASLAATLCLSDPEQIVGMRDADLPIDDANAVFYHQLDLQALEGVTSQQIHLYRGSYYFITKKPLQNAEQKIDGVIYHCQLLENAASLWHLTQADKKFHQQDHISYQVAPAQNRYQLSRRELQCLFHLLRGKSSKDIAGVLGLSKRTIDFYIDNIKNKFGCQNKASLIVAAIEAGYMNIIPA